MDPHEFKWGWDAQKKRVHHWPSSDHSRRTHRDDFAKLIGRPVSVRDGDVMGHGTYLPEERKEDGNVVGPPTVLLRATYNAEIPTDVLHHFENVYPATEVRRGHKHEHAPAHHEAAVGWTAPPSAAAWARENFGKPMGYKLSPIKIPTPVNWRVAGADMEGAMVAVFIPEATGKKIQVDGGEPLDLLHITLAYFEDKAADRDDWDKAAAIVERIAEKHGALEGKIGGYGVFKGEKGDVLWASPDVPGLAELRHELVEELETEGFDLNDEHGWTPHITLKYDWSGDFPDMEEPIPVTFEEVTLARGEKKQHKKLSKLAMAGRTGDPTLDKYFERKFPGQQVEYQPAQRQWTAAAPQVMYHVAPTRAREAIRTQGLQPQEWSDGNVYLFADLEEAKWYRRMYEQEPPPEPLEIWQVDVSGLEPEKDYGLYSSGEGVDDSAHYVTQPIGPERLRLAEENGRLRLAEENGT